MVYSQLVRQVINEGVAQDPSTVRAHYADGKPAPTISVEGVSFAITPEMGVPILQSKFVGHKWALTEIEWIWQEMSNDVAWLNDRGVTIWDEWKQEDGTIGKAYGWQLGHKKRSVEDCEMNQVEYVIHQLKHNPSSRRIMTTLWDVEDLDDMSLEPCVWATHWTVQEGKLNLHVKQRSADIALGLPYNVLQYHALHALMAEEVGL
ncbi:thymidylate synthase, partial [Arthrospira platensis SPKY2]